MARSGAPATRASLTYSFGNLSNSYYSISYANSEPFVGFEAFGTGQATAARDALQDWANVANVSFTEVADSFTVAGDLRFASSQAVNNSGALAWAYTPWSDTEAGDVWFPIGSSSWDFTPGLWSYYTMLHEVGELYPKVGDGMR